MDKETFVAVLLSGLIVIFSSYISGYFDPAVNRLFAILGLINIQTHLIGKFCDFIRRKENENENRKLP